MNDGIQVKYLAKTVEKREEGPIIISLPESNTNLRTCSLRPLDLFGDRIDCRRQYFGTRALPLDFALAGGSSKNQAVYWIGPLIGGAAVAGALDDICGLSCWKPWGIAEGLVCLTTCY